MGIPDITDVEMMTIHPQSHKSEYSQSLKLNSFPIYASISNNIPVTVKDTRQKTDGHIESNPPIGNNIGIQ